MERIQEFTELASSQTISSIKPILGKTFLFVMGDIGIRIEDTIIRCLYVG